MLGSMFGVVTDGEWAVEPSAEGLFRGDIARREASRRNIIVMASNSRQLPRCYLKMTGSRQSAIICCRWPSLGV